MGPRDFGTMLFRVEFFNSQVQVVPTRTKQDRIFASRALAKKPVGGFSSIRSVRGWLGEGKFSWFMTWTFFFKHKCLFLFLLFFFFWGWNFHHRSETSGTPAMTWHDMEISMSGWNKFHSWKVSWQRAGEWIPLRFLGPFGFGVAFFYRKLILNLNLCIGTHIRLHKEQDGFSAESHGNWMGNDC